MVARGRSFRLVLDRDPTDHLDALFEAGCGDALFGTVDGAHSADFTREAPTLEAAIGAAIRDVQSVGRLRVMAVQ